MTWLSRRHFRESWNLSHTRSAVLRDVEPAGADAIYSALVEHPKFGCVAIQTRRETARSALASFVCRVEHRSRNSFEYHDDRSRHLGELVADVLGVEQSLRPEWATADARSLARAILAGKDTGPMPILADALQDAGCTDERMLKWLRSDVAKSPHAWIVRQLAAECAAA